MDKAENEIQTTPARKKLRVALPPRRRLVPVLAIVAVLAAGLWWFLHRGLESTDNAQLDADIVGVPSRVAGTVQKVFFEENQPVKAGDLLVQIDDEPYRAKVAQAEGALAAARASADAAEAEARLAGVRATSDQSAASATYAAASQGAAGAAQQISEAEAAVKAAEAQLAQAELERTRQRALLAQNATAQASVDHAETAWQVADSNLEVARAHLATLRASVAAARSRVSEAGARWEQAKHVDDQTTLAASKARAARAQADAAAAALDLARLELSWTQIRAPGDGTVSKKNVIEGQAVSAGAPVVQLVKPQIWVTGNFKETQVADMRPGQPAHVEVDAFPGVELEGEVESFAGATGARFTLLPPDNATGNFTKVVQRVPVRVRLHELPADLPLRPGLSVELTVDTNG